MMWKHCDYSLVMISSFFFGKYEVYVVENDSKIITLTKNIIQKKNPQFCSDLAEILAILPIHELIILTKFDGDWTEIVHFLLLIYFWASIIFFESVSSILGKTDMSK